MQTVYSDQANIVTLPVAAKASGAGITAGTVNFYLLAMTGDNAGKWYKADGGSWESSSSIAGAATHKDDGHWQLSLASGVWTKDVEYLLYAKEDGNLHIPVEKNIVCKSRYEKAFAAWLMGNWRLKSGTTNTYEILDPDDGATVIAESTPNASTGIMEVTLS